MGADVDNVRSKLRRMSWDEYACRARQGLSKRVDALRYRFLPSLTLQTSPSRPEAGEFFFRRDQLPGIIAVLKSRLPEAVNAVLQQAERICSHRFNLLGYEDLDFGSPLDWHLDPVSGKRAPAVLWYKVPSLDFSSVGDAKIIWELNRHQHLVTLAKAYAITRDQRFATELMNQWHGWQQQNPYPFGINWASSLEVAFRALSWLWIRALLAGSDAFDDAFRRELNESLLLAGRHIERYLSTYFSPNTHLLGEAVALFSLGLLCPGAPRRWRNRAWSIVLQQADAQIRADGAYFEQSTYYHVYAVDFFLHARILAQKNGMAVPPEFDATLNKALGALALLAGDGVPFRFGDDDGGRVFDPWRNRAEHLCDPLATGAVLYDRPELKRPRLELTEEAVWLLGVPAVEEFDRISTTSTPLRSAALVASGLYVMSGREAGTRLILDAGPHGALGGGHGHADALAVQVTVRGEELLGDRGTFAYVGAGPERGQFRGTPAHNTVVVGGQDQAEPVGPFRWRRLPQVNVEFWAAGQGFDLLCASHDGYVRPPEGVRHRRWVFNLKDEFWLIVDNLLGSGQHQISVNWQFAPGVDCRAVDATTLARGERGGVALICMQDHPCSAHLGEDWHSPVYGKRVPSRTLKFGGEAALPTEIATVIAPWRQGTESGVLRRIRSHTSGAAVCAFAYTSNSNHLFLFSNGHHWRFGELASDARFLYYGKTCAQTRLVVCGVRVLESCGEPVLAFSSPVHHYEWQVAGGQAETFCSDECGARVRLGPGLRNLEALLQANGVAI